MIVDPNNEIESKYFDPYYPPESNFVERMRYWTSAKPDQFAFRFVSNGEDNVTTMTNKQLDRNARALAVKLLLSGMCGKRALLLFPPGLDFITAFFGCLYAKVIPVPAYPPRRNRNMGRINAISEDAAAAMVLTVRSVIDRSDGMLEDAPSLETIPWLAIEEVQPELAGDWVKPEIKGEEIAFLQYTSGSTGSPKGVMLTHSNIMANCFMITRAFGIRPDQEGLVTWLPLYHDMGLIGGVLVPFYSGVPTTMMSPVSFLTKPIRWLNAISKYKATVSGGPNFAYALCTERVSPEECEGLDLSSWSLAFNGAEPVRADVLEKFNRKFAPFGFEAKAHYPCYGMAESTLMVTGSNRWEPIVIREFDRPELEQGRVKLVDDKSQSYRRLTGCGHELPGETVIVIDPETNLQVADDQIGEIWVDSPSVGIGYWQKPEESAETFLARLADDQNGTTYLRTGDLGFFNQGELFVTGRLKDLIIVRGVNRYPQDIEATVENCSHRLRAAGAAAFAIDGDEREQLIVVCEVERDRTNKHWGDVIEKIRADVIEEHDLPPDGVVLVRANSVPKTSSGKVQRHACRQRFLNNDLLVVAKWLSWSDESIDSEPDASEIFNGKPLSEAEQRVTMIVIDQVRQVAKERAKKIDLDTNIVVDLGLDSLERLSIASGLERTFGGRIPDDVLQEVETVREVTQAVLEHIGSEPVSYKPEVLEPQKSAKQPIPEISYQIEKMPEFTRVQQLKGLLENTGIRNPFFTVHDGRISNTTQIDGRELISYASYNYVGLSGHPEVNDCAKAAIDHYGTSVSASRIVSGEKKIHREFESELSQFLGVDDVITFAGGHATNETVIGHLLGPGDMIIHDSLAHNSIIQGAELSGARRRPFEHNDWKSLDSILSEIRHEYRRVLIAIEGLYSMDGDFPNLPKFVEVKKQHKCWLFVDEAHSIGTMGKTGRGMAEHYNVAREDVELWMGTLSKSFGSCGGFIGGNEKLIEYLRYTTPGYVFAAGMPPANVGAALGSLRLLVKEPSRVERLQKNSALFLSLAQSASLNTGPSNSSPIIPVITGDSIRALKLSEGLFDRGINAQPILHPAVEEEQTRLRFFITSEHTEEQIRYTVDTVTEELNCIIAGKRTTPA